MFSNIYFNIFFLCRSIASIGIYIFKGKTQVHKFYHNLTLVPALIIYFNLILFVLNLS